MFFTRFGVYSPDISLIIYSQTNIYNKSAVITLLIHWSNIPNATAFFERNNNLTASLTNWTFSGVLTDLHHRSFPFLSVLPVSSNRLTHIWIASGTELLRRITNFCQKAHCVKITVLLISKYTCAARYLESSMFSCSIRNGVWNDVVNKQSQRNPIHPPNPNSAQVLPSLNCWNEDEL